ncbi:MAG: response regulator transcription factor [Ruminococcus sp.]|nr:response regulator transcription factor [Ruminococcus sp.]
MIWCVDDDDAIRDIEVYTLQSTGFEARGFSDGATMLAALQTEKPQLIIMDIMLPGEDGVELLKKLRAAPATKKIPVIMATAKGLEYDKIQSLDLGADDYLVKPFGVMEMVSRVKAVLRRCTPEQSETLSVLGLTVNIAARTVTADGEKIQLTYKEFEILRLLMSHIGTVFTREQLLSEVWGTDYYGETRTVDMHIKTLRQKLLKYGALIQTVIHVGYRMEAVL